MVVGRSEYRAASGSRMIIQKVWRALGRRGRRVFQELIWPVLPDGRLLNFNDVIVNIRKKWLSDFFPVEWLPVKQSDIPTYESGSVKALKSAVRKGDKVVVIGGGYGVTAVWAARLTGSHGCVLCLEGSADRATDVRIAARQNAVADRIEVVNAVVGEKVSLFGDGRTGPNMRPEELPECNVLEMDCEGSEVSIIESMVVRPRDIIVETHGFHGAKTSKVKRLLENLSYDVTDMGVAVSHKRDYCETMDIRVLLARRIEIDR